MDSQNWTPGGNESCLFNAFAVYNSISALYVPLTFDSTIRIVNIQSSSCQTCASYIFSSEAIAPLSKTVDCLLFFPSAFILLSWNRYRVTHVHYSTLVTTGLNGAQQQQTPDGMIRNKTALIEDLLGEEKHT